MRKIFTRLSGLLLLFILPAAVFAQESKDYNLMLNTGKFIPVENITGLTKDAEVFQRSLFNSKHYITIQFSSLPDQAMKEQLKLAGIELLDYIPYMAYTAAVSNTTDPAVFRNFPIRSVLQFTVAQKTVPDILIKKVPAHAERISGYADVDVELYENMSADKIAISLAALGATILADVPVFRMYTVRVPIYNLRQLVGLPFVQWVEFNSSPNVPENLPGRLSHRVNVLNDGFRNLKGDGMNVGVWDEIVSQHLDFSPAGRLINVDPGGAGSHGTHLSGTIGGRGLINPIARGMAPNATLYSYNGYDGGLGAFDNNLAEMAVVIPANTLISSNHSYHDGLGVQCVLGGAATNYTLRARNVDINLNNNTFHLHCHSAGNAQSSCANGWFTLTGTGKVAKNNIVVAALTGADAMTSYSSFGPSNDGRVKPDISAVGDAVFSTYTPLNSYNTISGTSMATPGIAGTVTLLAQRYKQLNSNALPPSMLIKNIVLNTARDLGNAGPDYRFGYGRVDALKAVRIMEETRYILNNIATAATNDITVTVPAGAARLRVMLTWNDPAGAANASVPLVNNLDLRVVEGANTYLPWILNPNSPTSAATQADDNISNVEQVTVDNPAAGTYTLRVIGEAVPTGPNQAYALTWEIEQPFIEVTYPNGDENLNPGGAQAITWDNAGVTGNQTVEYSINNGASWNVISTTVPSGTTRFSWTVPAGTNTSTALVRVSSGAITDNSDATFKILGTVTGFAGSGVSCNAGEVIFTWSAPVNTTHFDIYRLDPATGDFVILAADVTGTTYTATGLTPNLSMWFTIRSKNNTTGAVSERANAINVTVSNGGGGLGAVGSISGLTAVCGNQNGIVYSISAVAGATSYTWAVPAGVTIVSGQGTTSITVNFTAGSNGNITVFASNGSCQTAPSSLPVTSGNAAGAPLSGGDQTQTVCPGGSVPTLTATATVPAGYTVVWYNAATGGSVVASPTLSAAGTITYYAASRETATGCESATRTPVVLTINQVPSASIAAGGATTFCQGGSVVLTANTGSSWLWSNGATTQSITVSATGSFTVQVTTGSCVSTSPATAVTVNPVPTANVTAGGPTTFCEGLNVVLTASAGSSWLWSNGATTQSITVSASGNYTVTVTNAFSCSATSAATTVTVNPNPPAVITAGGAVTFCQGGSVVLTANAGNSYLWSNGATTQSITVNAPLGATNYTVQVTQAGGCVSNSPATSVTVNPIPAANISAGGPVAFCQGGSVALTASAGTSWLWSNGATTQTINATSTGNYSVTVTNASGCSAASASTAVAVSPNPTVTISASPYTRLYPGLVTTLTANVTPPGTYNFTWFKNGTAIPGATGATLSGMDIDDLGSYTVTVTNTSGLPCSNTSPALALLDSAITKLFIMPNPNSGEFDVAYYSAGTDRYTVSLYDSKGAIIFSKSANIGAPYQRIHVNIKQHGRGVYQVVLTDKSGKRIANGQVLVQ
ncbi:MAG: S8 family serine peptidase [Chitinophagaceae bacterium]